MHSVSIIQTMLFNTQTNRAKVFLIFHENIAFLPFFHCEHRRKSLFIIMQSHRMQQEMTNGIFRRVFPSNVNKTHKDVFQGAISNFRWTSVVISRLQLRVAPLCNNKRFCRHFAQCLRRFIKIRLISCCKSAFYSLMGRFLLTEA